MKSDVLRLSRLESKLRHSGTPAAPRGLRPRISAFQPIDSTKASGVPHRNAHSVTCSGARCWCRGAAWPSQLQQPTPSLPRVAPPQPHSTRAIVCANAAPGADAVATFAPAPKLPFWKTYVSRKPLLIQALFDCLSNIRRQGPIPDTLDVAMVYVSSEYLEDYESLVDTFKQELPGLKNIFGCTGFGVIGVDEDGAHEVEAQPALSVTLASIPQAEVVVRHLSEADLPDGDAPPNHWSDVLGVPAFPEAGLSVVVLSDPSFSAVQDLLAGLDFAFPTATKIGGLSSSSAFGGSRTATFCWSASRETPPLAPAADTLSTVTGGEPARQDSSGGSTAVYTRGATIMSIHGEIQMDLMIAQGCRPLTSTTWTVDQVAPSSPTHVVALSREGVAKGRPLPALEAFQRELQSVLGGMSEVQLRRTVANLTVGVAPEGLKSSLEPQDFLIRALRGFDSEQCLVVGEYMRVGQRVQFMVRDKQGAQEDLASHGLSYKRKQLQAMLQGNAEQQAPPFGMLMFTCNGRGSGLYGEKSYDARTMSSYVPVPCAGFQCNGEIGRIGNTTHLHGFTCAVGVLRMTAAAALIPTTTTTTTVTAAASATLPPPHPPSSPVPSEQSSGQLPEQP